MIAFTTSDHSYINTKTKEKYISVTTLISTYKNKFDAEYWSRYKALEEILPGFNMISKLVGKDIRKLEKNLFDNYPDLLLLYQDKIVEIRESWKRIAKEGTDKGTLYHGGKEDDLYTKGKILLDTKFGKINLQVQDFRHITKNETYENCNICDNLMDLEDGVYPELLIWNDKYKIAGQADEIIILTNPNNGSRHIVINDHKTNKVIRDKSYKTKEGYTMMLAPVDNLMDCEVSHYKLQLSLYAWMLEQFGFSVDMLSLRHYEDTIHLEYIREDINNLLKHFNNTLCQ